MCINEAVFATTDGQQRGRFGLTMRGKPKTDRASRRRRVLVVDRHALMRRAAAGWINHCAGLEVCGMASGMAQGLRAVKRLHPDVVVSEILRPHDLSFIRELHRRHPRLPILAFSMQDEGEYGARALEAGACAYLMKEAGGDELVRSIRALVRGRRNHPLGAPTRVS